MYHDPVHSGPAWDLFQGFREHGEKRILQCLERREYEDPFLDYKLSKGDTLAIFAKAASAFANSNGGVIVWGIIDKGNDSPRELSAISEVVTFASRLTELASQTLDAPLSGMISEPIVLADGSGYVVTFVPESSHKPHAARGKDQGGCYMRSGCSSMPMPMFVVRAIILAGARAELKLVPRTVHAGHTFVKLRSLGGGDTPAVKLLFELSLENTGDAIAENVAIVLPQEQTPSHASYQFMFGGPETVYVSGESRKLAAMPPGAVLHPGMQIRAVRLTVTFVDIKRAFAAGHFRMPYALFARHFSYHGVLDFTYEQLRHFVDGENGYYSEAKPFVLESPEETTS
jgi:hypothetical protein